MAALMKKMILLYPDEFNREGKPLTEPSSSIYGDLIVANRLAEYSRASAMGKRMVH